MTALLIAVITIAGSFVAARIIRGWHSWGELLQGSAALAAMGVAGGLLEESVSLALGYAATGAVAGTVLLWLVADHRPRNRSNGEPELSARVVRSGNVLVIAVLVEGVAISVLWLTELIPLSGLIVGIGIFCATLIGLLVTGWIARKRISQQGG